MIIQTDIWIAESGLGRIRVIRTADGAAAPLVNRIFAGNLMAPFGIAFYPLKGEPHWVYVANLNSIVRFPYKNGDLKASGPAQVIVASIPGGASYGGGHWTRSLVFSNDGKKLYVGVGSKSNVGDDEAETNRADVLEYTPAGKFVEVYAYGIRN